MKYLIAFLFIGFLGNAQSSAKKQLDIKSDGNTITVREGEKTFTYDFLLPNEAALNSYFLSSEKNTFYVKFEYKGSAISLFFDLVKFKFENGKLYLTEYIALNNRTGVWSGVVGIVADKEIRDFDDIEATLFSRETNNSNIKIFGKKGEEAALEIPKKIEHELLIEDSLLIGLLDTARNFIK